MVKTSTCFGSTCVRCNSFINFNVAIKMHKSFLNLIKLKTNLDSNYIFPIDLAPMAILQGGPERFTQRKLE